LIMWPYDNFIQFYSLLRASWGSSMPELKKTTLPPLKVKVSADSMPAGMDGRRGKNVGLRGNWDSHVKGTGRKPTCPIPSGYMS
jgi:hypothetical protein